MKNQYDAEKQIKQNAAKRRATGRRVAAALTGIGTLSTLGAVAGCEHTVTETITETITETEYVPTPAYPEIKIPFRVLGKTLNVYAPADILVDGVIIDKLNSAFALFSDTNYLFSHEQTKIQSLLDRPGFKLVVEKEPDYISSNAEGLTLYISDAFIGIENINGLLSDIVSAMLYIEDNQPTAMLDKQKNALRLAGYKSRAAVRES
jgi:hypothetical protein